MKTILKTIAIAFLFCISCTPSQNSENSEKEQELVQTTFENYKAAILKDNGNEAIKFVDSKTIKYYTELLELILTADSSKVNSLSIIDKFQILTIRAKNDKAKLLSFDGKQLLAYTIDEGMTSKNVAGSKIENIIIDGNFAKGQLSANGQLAPIYFDFHKEDRDWKLDITSILKISMPVFNQMIKESGQEENEFINSMLEAILGKKPSNEIWSPIK